MCLCFYSSFSFKFDYTFSLLFLSISAYLSLPSYVCCFMKVKRFFIFFLAYINLNQCLTIFLYYMYIFNCITFEYRVTRIMLERPMTEKEVNSKHNKPLEAGADFKVPAKRHCTDVLFAILLLACWVAMTFVGFVSFGKLTLSLTFFSFSLRIHLYKLYIYMHFF